METVAYIGLGEMGLPIAQRLVQGGVDCVGHDLRPERLAAFAASGGRTSHTLEPALACAGIVLTVLQNSEAVQTFFADPRLPTLVRPGSLFIECSTIDVETSASAKRAVQAFGCDLIDAPVSGGTVKAAEGKLTIMVGGSDEAFARAQPYLSHAASNVMHVGQHGAGIGMKLCNNMICGVALVAVAEACLLADELGLDLKTFVEVVQRSSGQTFAMDVFCPVPGIVKEAPSSNGYRPGGRVQLLAKDLMLAQAEGRRTGTTMPMTDLATSLFKVFSAAGGAELDVSAIIKFLSKDGLGTLRTPAAH